MSADRQVAAVPFRRRPDGTIEVLLVTSRETRRWVVPKGWPWKGTSDSVAAAGEAWEEAGVRGAVLPAPIGAFCYDKLRASGMAARLVVDVFLLEVTEEAAAWPEAQERQRAWFAPDDAAKLVAEPELQALLLALGQR